MGPAFTQKIPSATACFVSLENEHTFLSFVIALLHSGSVVHDIKLSTEYWEFTVL